MLNAYSQNVEVTALGAVPFENVSLVKGETALMASPQTIQLNRCGVYAVDFAGSAAAAQTVQLYKNGVPQQQAIATGTTPVISTLVQVQANNGPCACQAPTNLQIIATNAGTLTAASIRITKIC